jgi:hypothetical protein
MIAVTLHHPLHTVYTGIIPTQIGRRQLSAHTMAFDICFIHY